jgi:hypothetical protein
MSLDTWAHLLSEKFKLPLYLCVTLTRVRAVFEGDGRPTSEGSEGNLPIGTRCQEKVGQISLVQAPLMEEKSLRRRIPTAYRMNRADSKK